MSSASEPILETAIADGRIGSEPFGVYSELHSTGEAFCFSRSWDAAVFFKYEAVADILRSPKAFSNRGRVVNHLRNSFPAEARGELKPLADHYSQGLINSDPPDHTRLRRLIQPAFHPRILEGLRPRVEEICAGLLDRAAKRSEIEFVQDFAFQLPIAVIAEMLGIPRGMREQFKDWSTRVVEFMGKPNPSLAAMRRSQVALLELRAYFAEVFEERRRQPGDDVISLLVTARDEGDKLTEEELLSTCVTLLIGGHETTTALLSSAAWHLGVDLELRDRLASDLSLLKGAVEEFLRLEPPFHRILRVAEEDAERCGARLRSGQSVVLLLGAANRDPTQFPDPDRFDAGRSPNRHLAFGHGMHHCLGAGLARLEAPEALRQLLERFPEFRCENPRPTWKDGMVRSIERLHLRLA